jgi:hypothetical protein
VLFPTAACFKKLQQLADTPGLELLLIINPQWELKGNLMNGGCAAPSRPMNPGIRSHTLCGQLAGNVPKAAGAKHTSQTSVVIIPCPSPHPRPHCWTQQPCCLHVHAHIL